MTRGRVELKRTRGATMTRKNPILFSLALLAVALFFFTSALSGTDWQGFARKYFIRHPLFASIVCKLIFGQYD